MIYYAPIKIHNLKWKKSILSQILNYFTGSKIGNHLLVNKSIWIYLTDTFIQILAKTAHTCYIEKK